MKVGDKVYTYTEKLFDVFPEIEDLIVEGEVTSVEKKEMRTIDGTESVRDVVEIKAVKGNRKWLFDGVPDKVEDETQCIEWATVYDPHQELFGIWYNQKELCVRAMFAQWQKKRDFYQKMKQDFEEKYPKVVEAMEEIQKQSEAND